MNYFDLKVGFSCNNDCIHCVVTDKRDTKDSSTEEIKAIIDNIPKDTIVGFTGGEPTIRKDFIELLKYCKEKGHKTALQTNGVKFENYEFAYEVSLYLDSVLIAIHSHDQRIHDSIVGGVGMFNSTIKGFKNIIKIGIDCNTQTVMSSLNIGQLLKTYDFIQSIAPGMRMNLTYPHLNGSAWENRYSVSLRYSDIKDIIQSILQKYHFLLNVEAIPKCYLYPYQDSIYNFDSLLLDKNSGEKRSGMDPANRNTEFFNEKGIIEDYSVSQLAERIKGPRCEECIFNDSCAGVWKEYAEMYKNSFDLYPVVMPNNDNKLHQTWGSLIIYGQAMCQNRCTFCLGTNEEETLEIKQAKVLRDSNHFLATGVSKIEISGGDPGEYLDIVNTVKYLKVNGIEEILLSTHGRTLKDEQLVIDLKNAGLDSVRIPLYGSTDKIHNKTVQYDRPVGNAFNETIEGIKNCSKHGIDIVGYIVPNQYNKNNLIEIIQLYKDITKNNIKKLMMGISFIANKSYDYTADWFLPIKDMGSFLIPVKESPVIDDVAFLFLDYPHCVFGECTERLENVFEGFPNLGTHKVEEENRSEESDFIPHYRIKSHFDECKNCSLNKVCGGIPKNEIEMFGTAGLKGIK